MSDLKRCTRCESLLPLDEFYARASGKRESRCRNCCARIAREWHAKNREKANAERSARYYANPVIRVCAVCEARKHPSEFSAHLARACLTCAPVGTRFCRYCRVVKPVAVFKRSDRSGREQSAPCLDCAEAVRLSDRAKERAAARRRRESRPEEVRAKNLRTYEKNREWYLAHAKTPKGRASSIFSARKRFAALKGIRFDDSIRPEVYRKVWAGECEATGLPLHFGDGRSPFSPSIDRISPSLGYVPGNVRVVCWAVNSMVGDWGDDVAAQVAQAFLAARAREQRELLPELAPIYHAHPSAFPEPFVPC